MAGAGDSDLSPAPLPFQYHYIGPFGDYLGLMYANTPDHARDAKD